MGRQHAHSQHYSRFLRVDGCASYKFLLGDISKLSTFPLAQCYYSMIKFLGGCLAERRTGFFSGEMNDFAARLSLARHMLGNCICR